MTAYELGTRPTVPITATAPQDAAQFVYGPSAVVREHPTGCGWLVYVQETYVDDLTPAYV